MPRLRPSPPPAAPRLRARAEATLRGRQSRKPLTAKAIADLVHELEVHQIELQMQNEELRRAQIELERSRNEYAELYEFAPVGYCTLDANTVLLQANLRLASLLGVPRSTLIGKRLTRFIDREHQDVFYFYWRGLKTTGPPRACDLRLRTGAGGALPVSLETVALSAAGGQTRWRCALTDITQRKGAEENLRRRHENEWQRLTHALLTAQEESNRAIGRELHDVYGQELVAIGLDLNLRARAPRRNAAAVAALGQRLGQLAHQLHHRSRALHPAVIEDLGLEPALRQECESFQAAAAIPVEFSVRALPAAIPSAAALCLYRVAQECLRNVRAHAGDTRGVWVTLTGRPTGLTLTVADRGVGFAPSPAARRGGLGLISMEERVRAAGGTLEVRSQPGEGAAITAFVPLIPPLTLPEKRSLT